MNVTKRNGDQESFDAEKINKVIRWACENISGVSESAVAMNAEISLVDGIGTDRIHDLLVESAANMIDEENIGYSKVASNLLNYKLRKEVWGGLNPPKLYDHIYNKVLGGIYDPNLLEWYSKEEINKIDEAISHDLDYSLEYAGTRQLIDKYLISNRDTGEIYETPQFAYMLIAMVLFNTYSGANRLKYVKRAYKFFSQQKINLPTPIMAGIRSKDKSGASCCLIEMDDDLKSITSTASATMLATAARYGMGIDMSRIRPIGSPIRGGETTHTGVIPFLKVIETSIKSCKQGSARRGAGTVTFPIFHPEIEDILVLKNNTGTEDNRARHLDYSISISRIFWERLRDGKNISLFSSRECPELYDSFGLPEFDKLYLAAEKKRGLKFKKTIPAKQLFSLLFKERIETGRIYLLNIDNANQYSPWKNRVSMSNLCQEILHETTPIYDLNDEDGRIGVCVLGATNMLNISSHSEHWKVCDVLVRMLDELIDYQDYFSIAAERFAKERRSLGIGVINYAAWLANQGLKMTDDKAPVETSKWFERQQYFLLKASCELAKEKGRCEYSDNCLYTQGILPSENYEKSIDEFTEHFRVEDWDALRADLKEHGIRNVTLSAIMPAEASSRISGATNGIEPPRQPITYMKSKTHTLPCIIPNFRKRKNYTYAFDKGTNEGYLKCAAAINRWTCMAISSNLYYSYDNYEDRKLPLKEVIKDHYNGTRWGLKTFYYLNTDDGDKQTVEEDSTGCGSGGCSI